MVVGNIVSLNDAEVRGQHIVRAVDSDGGAGGVVAWGGGCGRCPVGGALRGVFDDTRGSELRVLVEVANRRGNRCVDGIHITGHAVGGVERQRVLMAGTAVQGVVVGIGAGAGGSQHVAAGGDGCEGVAEVSLLLLLQGHLDGAPVVKVKALIRYFSRCCLGESEPQIFVFVYVYFAREGNAPIFFFVN